MCDGSFGLKMYFIRELMDVEKPEKMQEYMQMHLTWTVEELKERLDRLDGRLCYGSSDDLSS